MENENFSLTKCFFYFQIRESFRQTEKTMKDFEKYVERTSNYHKLKVPAKSIYYMTDLFFKNINDLLSINATHISELCI